MKKEIYSSLINDYNKLVDKAEKTVINALNERGVESINVNEYMEKGLIKWQPFYKTDEDAWELTTTISTITKNDEGKWEAELLCDDLSYFDTLVISHYQFELDEMIDILKIIYEIFQVADEKYHGKVLKAGETFDEE